MSQWGFPGERRSRGQRWRPDGTLLAWLIIAGALVLTLFPLVWLVLTSLKTREEYLAMPPVWIFVPHFSNYETLFKTLGFGSKLLNSILVSIGGTLIALVIGASAGYGFSRARFRGKTALLFGILAVRMYPPITTLVPIFLGAASLGLLDSRATLATLYGALQLPLVIYLSKSFFDDIPIELEEAGAIDGASQGRIFWLIILPLVRPGLLTAGVFAFIMSWNEFMFALVLTAKQAVTAPIALSGFMSDHEIQWGLLSAIGVVTTAPVVILGLIIRRHLAKGLTLGAVK